MYYPPPVSLPMVRDRLSKGGDLINYLKGEKGLNLSLLHECLK